MLGRDGLAPVRLFFGLIGADQTQTYLESTEANLSFSRNRLGTRQYGQAGVDYYCGLLPSVAQPPFPLHEFLPGFLPPPWPLQSF
jgi:hypothetical protein